MEFRAIDGHIHCGVQNVQQSYETILPLLKEAGIDGVCMFPPVEDVYDRRDPNFQDDAAWQECRHKANQYVLDLAVSGKPVFPFFFVWNDFAIHDLDHRFCGIKWHRHTNEPIYYYDDPKCQQMIQVITERNLPITLEESFENTLMFAEKLAPNATIIIPHLGVLNGGFEQLEEAGIWSRNNIWADSSMADIPSIRSYLDKYGPDKLIFGSDYPFGVPKEQLQKILDLGLREEEERAILAGNVLRLLNRGEE